MENLIVYQKMLELTEYAYIIFGIWMISVSCMAARNTCGG